jgi:hypothetical protein
MFGGTTSHSERAKYILEDVVIIIFAFQVAQGSLESLEKLWKNFLDVIFGKLFIFVPPNKRLDPVLRSIRKWLNVNQVVGILYCCLSSH